MRGFWLVVPFLLAGCSGEAASAEVDAILLPGQGSPLIFEVTVDWEGGDLTSFDPEQHVKLEAGGNRLDPSNVIANPENDFERHVEYGVEFTADRGQAMTLIVTIQADEHRFGFDAQGNAL